MTLVVARVFGERIAIVSDTLLSQNGLPIRNNWGVIKSCMLPGNICVSFANSPELAARDFKEFSKKFPSGIGFSQTVSFFENSSIKTGNEYLLAFSQVPKLVKITDGKRADGTAKTMWIGDQDAYERFREYEAKQRKGVESGRAVNAALFMDELPKSPASDLYSTMRHVVADKNIQSTGGFVCVVSNRDGGFRHSVFSDMLYNWPDDEAEDFILQLTHQIDFGASGENSNYSIAQISTGILGLNFVAFYLLKGKMLFLYRGIENGLADDCTILSGVEPADINHRLDEIVGSDLRWLLTVASASSNRTDTSQRPTVQNEMNQGVGFEFICHANTFPKSRK